MDYKFISTFTSVAKISVPTENDRFVAKASLVPLKGILPADVNPEDTPDLLFISCNGAVAGLCNRNGDAVSNETALEIFPTAKNKYISTDHDRDKVVGVILYPGLTRFGGNEPITVDQAKELKEPFNMAFAGVIWRAINPMLVKYLNNTVGEDDDALSMSWEIAFNSYDIGVGSKNLFDAKVISAEDASFDTYNKYLRANGGEGKDPAGQNVFRIIKGPSIILGYSIVARPAAEVKGILTFDKQQEAAVEAKENASSTEEILNEIPESQRGFLKDVAPAGLGYHLCDIVMTDGTIHQSVAILNGRYLPKEVIASNVKEIKICEKSQEKNINPSDTCVNLNTEKTMKISTIQEFETAIAKFEGAAAVVDFVKAIQQGSEQYVQELAKKDALIKDIETAKAENEKRAKELESSLATVKQELATIRAQAEATALEQKFQERMAAFDEEFDLDDEDRKLIASDIKDLNDEAFASYFAKAKKLMCGKAKKKQKSDGEGAQGGKKSKDDDNDKGKESDDDEDDKGDKKSKASDEHKDAFASVKADEKETKPLVDQPLTNVSLKDEMAKAFASTIKLNGKPILDSQEKSKKTDNK